MILFSVGAPLTPAGGSSCNLKSKINRYDYHFNCLNQEPGFFFKEKIPASMDA